MKPKHLSQPNEFCFSIQHDLELGGFYSVFAKFGQEDLSAYDPDLLLLVPTGFYPVSNVENLYGFDMDPTEARRVLKNKGFVENIDLI